jgi:hypothetical protein
MSTRKDHIAPWRSTDAATQTYRGPVKFVLSASGHIAGVVNPPGGEYGHWENNNDPPTPEEWLAHRDGPTRFMVAAGSAGSPSTPATRYRPPSRRPQTEADRGRSRL